MTKLRLGLSKGIERLDVVRDASTLKRWDYMGSGQNGCQGVFCKLCGGLIRGLVSGYSEFVETLTYSEIEIAMQDGSSHITPLCQACSYGGLVQDQLEAIFMSDLERLAEIDDMDLMDYDRELERVPESYKVIK